MQPTSWGGAHVDPEIPANLLRTVQGNVKLCSIQLGEENVITRAVAETAYQVLLILDNLIPQLAKDSATLKFVTERRSLEISRNPIVLS